MGMSITGGGGGGGGGTPGAAGANGKSVRNGSGPPLDSLGINGDFYIDTDVHHMYGPKTLGTWGDFTPLIISTDTLPVGAALYILSVAPTNELGYDGDWAVVIPQNHLYGPKGSVLSGVWPDPTNWAV